jgi:hypothetical protein
MRPLHNKERVSLLRRIVVDSFLEGNDEAWVAATQELRGILKAEGLARKNAAKGDGPDFYHDRGKRQRKKNTTPNVKPLMERSI